jgi:hypothetical protein
VCHLPNSGSFSWYWYLVSYSLLANHISRISMPKSSFSRGPDFAERSGKKVVESRRRGISKHGGSYAMSVLMLCKCNAPPAVTPLTSLATKFHIHQAGAFIFMERPYRKHKPPAYQFHSPSRSATECESSYILLQPYHEKPHSPINTSKKACSLIKRIR